MPAAKKATNITVPFSHDGVHYKGVSALNGVAFKLIPAPCVDGGKLIEFSKTANPPAGIFFQGVSGIQPEAAPVDGYLVLKYAR